MRLALLLAALLVPTTAPAQVADGRTSPADLVSLLREGGEHRTLVRALGGAGLASALQGEGPFTVFAPTDTALRKLPPRSLSSLRGVPAPQRKMRRILLGHVVKGSWTAAELAKHEEVRTLAGTRLQIGREGDALTINGVRLPDAPAVASNGLSYAMPFLLMPLSDAAPTTETSELRFPPAEGSNLERQAFALPGEFEAEYNLAIIAFAQIHQRSVDTWIPLGKEIEAAYEGFRYYELPTIAPMGKLMQAFVDRGMAAGIPSKDTRSRTITLYIPLEPFLSPLGLRMDDREHIHTFLVRKDGKVLWHARGPLTREAIEQVRAFAASNLKLKQG